MGDIAGKGMRIENKNSKGGKGKRGYEKKQG